MPFCSTRHITPPLLFAVLLSSLAKKPIYEELEFLRVVSVWRSSLGTERSLCASADGAGSVVCLESVFLCSSIRVCLEFAYNDYFKTVKCVRYILR